MSKNYNTAKDNSPIIKITLINYNPAIQDEYSKKFMSPLIEGLLKRTQLAEAKYYNDKLRTW